MGLQWSSSAPEEREALLGLPTSPARGSRVFGRRWLVLGLFSMLAFMQGMVWNTWGPIQGSAKQAYGFSSLDIALLVLWGPIGFLPCFLFMWLMDKKGLRVSMLLTSALMVIGSGLRCVPVSNVIIKQSVPKPRFDGQKKTRRKKTRCMRTEALLQKKKAPIPACCSMDSTVAACCVVLNLKGLQEPQSTSSL